MNGKEFTTTRRRALKIISAAIIGLLVYLSTRFTRFFVRKKRTLNIALSNKRPHVQMEGQVVLVWEKGTLKVLSRTCPHLGCKIGYDAQTQRFVCPCHGSRFALNGRYLKGPARKNLTNLKFKLKGNHLSVTL